MSESEFFATHPEVWFWLSFASPHHPPGETFLGVVVVKTTGKDYPEALWNAMQEAKRLGLAPEGHCYEVRGVPVPPETIPEQFRNRLLTREDIVGFDLGASTVTGRRTV